MARKKSAEKPQREFTRRQLSHWQRQKRRQNIILGGGIFIIAAVIFILLAGWYVSEYRPVHQTVISVNDTKFNMSYYMDVLALAGEGQTAEYIQNMADNAITEIKQDELIRQGAAKLGISVSDDEVKEQLKGSTIPINKASLDLVRSQILQSRLNKEYFASQAPKSAAQVNIMVMLLESEGQAAEVIARLENSENFTAIAYQLSLDYYSKNQEGDIGWHTENITAELLGSSVLWEYAWSSESGVLSQPIYDQEKNKQVGYWLAMVLEKQDDTNANVQAMLLGSEQEAQAVAKRLMMGEDFATLATELSQDEESRANGGDLGLVSEGTMSPAFDEVVFNPDLQPGTLCGPIRDGTVATKGGYWLIKVLDKADDRPLESYDVDYLSSKAFNSWLSALWDDPNNGVDDSYLDDEMKLWAVERVVKKLGAE